MEEKNAALVTGASSGIGRAIAQTLAAQRMNLLLSARSEGPLKELAGELESSRGIEVEVIPADLGP
jgi:hypothetical protein